MKYLIVLVLLITQACTLCDHDDHEQVIQCLNEMPKRKLNNTEQKAYITLSTSPQRISKIIPTLKTLDLEHIERIFLALPKKYRNKEPYGPIPEAIRNFAKLEIIAEDQDDLGPIMKMLPALEKVKQINDNAIVISIDDDNGLPIGAINELIYHATLFPNAVISGAGHYIEIFGILPEEWPSQGKAKQSPLCETSQISYCDTAEGWGAIAYRPRLVNTARLRELSQLSLACRTSDDLVISYVLAESAVPKIRIANRFFPEVHRFDFGTDSSGLQKIKIDAPGWSPRPSLDAKFSRTTNSERYQRCVLDIRSKIEQ